MCPVRRKIGSTPPTHRPLQPSRAEGLIKRKGDRPSVPDRDRLKRIGDFDPTCLSLENDQAAAQPSGEGHLTPAQTARLRRDFSG